MVAAAEVWSRGLETVKSSGQAGGCAEPERGRAQLPRGWRGGDPIPALPDLGACSSLLWKVYTFSMWLPAALAI